MSGIKNTLFANNEVLYFVVKCTYLFFIAFTFVSLELMSMAVESPNQILGLLKEQVSLYVICDNPIIE